MSLKNHTNTTTIGEPSSGRKKLDVLVVGELNVDLILDGIDQLPQLGKEILAGQMVLTLGSSSAIFATNLSSLGMKVAFFGKLGKDGFADTILKELQAKKVDVTLIQKTDLASTGITVALNYGNDRAMVTHPGAMEILEASEVTDDMLMQARHLHVSSLFLQPRLIKGIISLFERAKKLGLSTSMDPQWDPAEKWDVDWKRLLSHIDVFLPNIEEFKNLTGKESKEAAVEGLKKAGHLIVVKDGIRGAYGWCEGKWIHQPAFLNEKVADAIGAGDSFNAGYIHHFLQGHSMEECLEFGALMGAINTTRAGGTAAFEDLPSIKEIAQQQFNYKIK